MLDKAMARQIAHSYASIVREALDPKQIILFGSYVNGNPHEFSDIDIAVVFDDFQGNWYETAVLLGRLRRDVSIDIEPHLLDESCDRSGFLAHVVKTGEMIYQSA